jgi:hypothetical protein
LEEKFSKEKDPFKIKFAEYREKIQMLINGMWRNKTLVLKHTKHRQADRKDNEPISVQIRKTTEITSLVTNRDKFLAFIGREAPSLSWFPQGSWSTDSKETFQNFYLFMKHSKEGRVQFPQTFRLLNELPDFNPSIEKKASSVLKKKGKKSAAKSPTSSGGESEELNVS